MRVSSSLDSLARGNVISEQTFGSATRPLERDSGEETKGKAQTRARAKARRDLEAHRLY